MTGQDTLRGDNPVSVTNEKVFFVFFAMLPPNLHNRCRWDREIAKCQIQVPAAYHIHTNWAFLRHFSSETIAFGLKHLRHELQTGGYQIISQEGTWEPAVRQMKLKVLRVMAGRPRPLLFSDVRDHNTPKHLPPSLLPPSSPSCTL